VIDELSHQQPLFHGALVQAFDDEGGEKWVLNALYPGGGKLYARWASQLPEQVQEALSNWNPNPIFPVTSFSNINFQFAGAANALEFPGARPHGSGNLKIGDLFFEDKNGTPQVCNASGDPVTLNDISLESVDSRSPLLRLLHDSTVPFVSRSMFLDKIIPATKDGGWEYFPRQTQGSVVVQRACWKLEESHWKNWLEMDGLDFFLQLRSALRAHEIPSRFFARLGTEKPQYFSLDGVLFMLLFRQLLKKGSGMLQITECLPDLKPGRHASELVLEWKTDV
jgi:hypothetical protein